MSNQEHTRVPSRHVVTTHRTVSSSGAQSGYITRAFTEHTSQPALMPPNSPRNDSASPDDIVALTLTPVVKCHVDSDD